MSRDVIIAAAAVVLAMAHGAWIFTLGRRYERAVSDAEAAELRADMAEKPAGAWWVPEPRTRRSLSRLTFWAQMRVVAARMRRRDLLEPIEPLPSPPPQPPNGTEPVRVVVYQADPGLDVDAPIAMADIRDAAAGDGS